MLKITNKFRIMRGRLVAPFLAVIIVLAISYVCFGYSAVVEIIAKNQNITYLKDLDSEFMELEGEYFDTINDINIEYAYSLGFVDQGKNEFVVRSVEVASR